MFSSAPRSLKNLLFTFALGCVVTLLTGCTTITGPWTPTTSVTPLATDDLKSPCKYELILSGPEVTQTGVLVIFQRSDSMDLYKDPAVRAMATQLHMALMFAYECDAKSFSDFQYDATKGPGRALFLALSQLATLTEHPELATANVVLYGFSAGGYLGMTLTNAYPGRVLGAILDAPASGYADLNDEAVSSAAANVPMLILANADDTQAGTQRPFNLFIRGQAMGAPWGFGVQNATGHCCTDSTRSLLIPWVTAIMQDYTVPSATGQAALRTGLNSLAPTVQFTCSFDGFIDVLGEGNCLLVSVSVLPVSAGGLVTAWLPDSSTTDAWVNWVTNPDTN
ncbi:MAG: hypothetical protein ACRYFU_04160 [Janthinobacterium lividum]